MIKIEAHLVRATFRCDKAGPFTVPIDKLSFTASHAECEICGSHGSVIITLREPCRCGRFHTIEVASH